jgi:hypothetical protein
MEQPTHHEYSNTQYEHHVQCKNQRSPRPLNLTSYQLKLLVNRVNIKRFMSWTLTTLFRARGNIKKFNDQLRNNHVHPDWLKSPKLVKRLREPQFMLQKDQTRYSCALVYESIPSDAI